MDSTDSLISHPWAPPQWFPQPSTSRQTEDGISYKQLYEAEKRTSEAEKQRAEFWKREYLNCSKQLQQMKKTHLRKRTASVAIDATMTPVANKRPRLAIDISGDTVTAPQPPVSFPPPPPSSSSPPPSPRRRLPPQRRRTVLQAPSHPGPPESESGADNRINERLQWIWSKKRLDDLYSTVKAAMGGFRFARTLFNKRIKHLVGDWSPVELGLNVD